MSTEQIMDGAVELTGPARPVSEPASKEDVMSFRNSHMLRDVIV